MSDGYYVQILSVHSNSDFLLINLLKHKKISIKINHLYNILF